MRSLVLMLACLSALVGCSPGPVAPVGPRLARAEVAPSANPTADASAPTTPDAAVPSVATAETLELPAGEFFAGSSPDLVGRDPRREAALQRTTLGAFDIDRRPFPGEASARLGLGVAQAARLCDERGRRLCSELEWEAACKLGGTNFETSGPEWTASEGGPAFGETETRIVRGGGETAELRCSSRRALQQDASPRGVGFRCCGGDTNSTPYPEPERAPAFHPLQVEDTRLREILATLPELARYASDFQLFRAADAERALSRCQGTPADLHGWELVDGVVEWAPGWGLPDWVFAGHSGDDAMVVVLHRTAEGFVHGASYVYGKEPASIALTFTTPSRDVMQFSASVGCAGEGGVLAAEPDGRVLAYHRRVGW
ncbi:MAG: hypothetical protein GW913_06720 [Myxococcales bacterium]|nr:hypothetical protein [Myxococcales bacterium]